MVFSFSSISLFLFLFMNITYDSKLKFFWNCWSGNDNLVVASLCVADCLQITLFASRPELNFKPFSKIHWLVYKYLCPFVVCALSSHQAQRVKTIIPWLCDVVATNCISVRVAQQFYFWILQSAVRVVKGLHLRRICRWCWIRVVLELPVVPAGQVRFCHVHYIYQLRHVRGRVWYTTELCHWKADF